MKINDKYSFKAYPYHKLSFKDRPASEFNDTEIIGSCFCQENKPDSDIFPNGIMGVIFKKCNLDNIYVPPGNTIKEGTHKKIKVQKDGLDWLLNDDLTPKEPLNKEITP